MQVHHHPQDQGGALVLMDGERRVGELTYYVRDGLRVIDHTWVDPSLRGKGVAGSLMEAVVSLARTQGWKLSATCSYAVWSFDKHPEFGDVCAT